MQKHNVHYFDVGHLSLAEQELFIDRVKQKLTKTIDCRSDEGVTIGLIDTLITVSRVLSDRDFSSIAVKEALKDLAEDKDLSAIMDVAKSL
jgi:hypothetical protein